MVKENTMSNEKEKKRFNNTNYTLIARACRCTPDYVRKVLLNDMGKYNGKVYTDRHTDLAEKIRQKAKELEAFINS